MLFNVRVGTERGGGESPGQLSSASSSHSSELGEHRENHHHGINTMSKYFKKHGGRYALGLHYGYDNLYGYGQEEDYGSHNGAQDEHVRSGHLHDLLSPDRGDLRTLCVCDVQKCA